MMADSDNSKDWPSLTDSNIACAPAVKNKHGDNSKDSPKLNDSSTTSTTKRRKKASKLKTEVSNVADTDGLDNVSSSTNTETGTRKKKQPGKTKWSPVQIDLLPYRNNRRERNNDFYRHVGSGYNNHDSRRFNNHEAAHNTANGHENSKGRAFRGGRGGRGYYRHRESSDIRRYSPAEEAIPVPQSGGINFKKSPSGFSEAIIEQVMRQIEYYFSEQNLIRDTFLRCYMDEQGYANLSFIADFPRMQKLTNNPQLILEAVKKSSHLEVSDDVKVRPVVDPLRWPLKKVICEDSSVSTSEYANLITAQMFNMSLNPLYHPISGPKSHLSGEHPWEFIPNDDQVCVVEDVYQVDSNDVPAVNPEISNGNVSPSEPLNSDLRCELTSQYLRNDYEIKNGAAICPVTEIPTHIVSNGIDSIANNSNIPNGQVYSSDEASIHSNGELSSQLSDLQIKNNDSFHPVNGICHRVNAEDINASACDLNVSNGFACSSGHRVDSEEIDAATCDLNVSNGFACSSDLRHASEMNAYNCYFGQLSNGVIMYNSGGHYFPHSEILASNTDSSDEKSALHNKSPEPSR